MGRPSGKLGGEAAGDEPAEDVVDPLPGEPRDACNLGARCLPAPGQGDVRARFVAAQAKVDQGLEVELIHSSKYVTTMSGFKTREKRKWAPHDREPPSINNSSQRGSPMNAKLPTWARRGLAATVVLLVLYPAAAAAGSSSATAWTPTSTQAEPLPGAQVLGAAGSQSMHVAVALNLRSKDALQQLVAAGQTITPDSSPRRTRPPTLRQARSPPISHRPA